MGRGGADGIAWRRGAGRRTKVITPEAAARLVLDGDTLATGGFVGIGFPEELALALERRFLDTGSPAT